MLVSKCTITAMAMSSINQNIFDRINIEGLIRDVRKEQVVIMCLDINIFLFFLSIFPNLIFLFLEFSFPILLDNKKVDDCGHMTCHMM